MIQLPGSGGNHSGSSGPGPNGSSGASSPNPADCSDIDDGENACVGESYEGETVPLDIYIMFDQSGSMSNCIDPVGELDPVKCETTRMEAVRQATAQFLSDPKSAGIGVGIGFFGKQEIGRAICTADDYSEPAVTIGSLPDHADAIMTALDGVAPTGETPTAAAIRGACSYARERKLEKPHEVVILLLTDGKPEAPITCNAGKGSCCPTLDDAARAAEECRTGDPSVRTYVLGVGPLLDNLREIAVAGGTEHAYLVEGGDVSRDVLQALNRIRGDAIIPCEFQLPEPPGGQQLVYDKVNIKYSDPTCRSTYFYYVGSQAECGATGGWYYDDQSNPQKIHLCPTSCDQVSVPGGRLFYNVGCDTRYLPR